MNSSRNPDSADSSYTMGYSDEFLQLLDRRNAETNAAHLLAHLEPGMRVLDRVRSGNHLAGVGQGGRTRRGATASTWKSRRSR